MHNPLYYIRYKITIQLHFLMLLLFSFGMVIPLICGIFVSL